MTNEELAEALGLVVSILKELAMHDHAHWWGEYVEGQFTNAIIGDRYTITDDQLLRLLELFPENTE